MSNLDTMGRLNDFINRPLIIDLLENTDVTIYDKKLSTLNLLNTVVHAVTDTHYENLLELYSLYRTFLATNNINVEFIIKVINDVNSVVINAFTSEITIELELITTKDEIAKMLRAFVIVKKYYMSEEK